MCSECAGHREKEELGKELKGQLLRCEEVKSSLAHCNARIRHLEQEIAVKEERVRELSEAFSYLDREHDSLRRETDVKDETIAELRQQLTEKVQI